MSLVTADQLLAHAVGDYLLQSDWMASEKTKRSVAAAAHAATYALAFLLLRPSAAALAVIACSHFAIDRWRLARFVVWAKNHLAPRATTWTEYTASFVAPGGKELFDEKIHVARWWHPWTECSATGYHRDRPPWLSVWLLIIADNALHVLINAAALRWL